MNKEQLDILKSYNDSFKEIDWDAGLVHRNGCGHTYEVADLKIVHSGTDTAGVYVYGKVTGFIGKEQGLSMLKAISNLQVKDSENERYGAFRWYLEESQPIDTNAAFFIMSPLAIVYLFSSESLSSEEITIIENMLSIACSWFLKECQTPILFYTNKIISDGALLTAIGKITNNDEYKTQARIFLLKWLDYTENRGYGWGENLSRGYNSITLQAFSIIKKALDDTKEDNEIRERFSKLENEIIETFRFNNGYEFVPTIRSYNITGITKLPSLFYNIAGVSGFGIKDGLSSKGESGAINLLKQALIFLIYDDRLYFDEADYKKRKLSNEQEVPRVKKTHIMDGKSAYSWIGEHGGLGSINEFPIIEGSYQHKKWGLGWQCMPVNMIVYDNQVSFLRFNVDSEDRIRNHPHKIKGRDFLDPALFRESFYPEVRTKCCQNNNTLTVVRDMCRMRNHAGSISDSLDIQRFKGAVYEYKINDRQWIAISYEKVCILVTPLLGIVESSNDYREMHIEIENKESNLRLSQSLYSGEYKTLYDDRLSTGWIIHFIDKGIRKEEIYSYIEKFNIDESTGPDGEVPRMPMWNVHDICVKFDGEELINHRFDPYV